MIRVNLIPYREEKRKADMRRRIIAAAGAVVVLVLVVGVFHAFLMQSVAALERDVSASQAELDRLVKITGDLDKYREDKALVEKKLQVITVLEKNRNEGHLMLAELSRSVPEGQLWLNNVSKRGSDLRLSGMARNNAAVALFMERLEASLMITSVDLITSRRVPYASTELKQFQLSAKIKQGESWQ